MDARPFQLGKGVNTRGTQRPEERGPGLGTVAKLPKCSSMTMQRKVLLAGGGDPNFT
jgi:hypothetical protein